MGCVTRRMGVWRILVNLLALLAIPLFLTGCNIPKVYRGTEFLLPTCLYCPDIAPPAAVTTPANVPVTLTYTVTDTDSPVVTLAAVKAPTKGTLSAFTLATTTGNMTSGYTFTFTVTYTPNTTMAGADSFDLQATDNSPTPNVSLVPTVNVTVTPYLTGITVAPANPLVPRGTTKQFSASGAYNDGMNRALPNAYNAITWSSGTPANATINSTGLASLPATGTITGTSAITATSGLISGSATLTVGMPTLVSLAVTPGNVTVPRGTSQQFTATGTFTDNTTGVITTLMTWTSGTTTNATIVSTSGLATAINTGNITGTSLITATDPASGKTGTATLTVGNPNLVSIAVGPGPGITVPRGTTQQFTATGNYSDTQALTLPSVYNTVTWSSLTTANATVDAAGLATAVNGGNIGGTAAIQAASGAIIGSATLTVGNPNLVSIAVSPANATILTGQTQQYIATGTFSDATALALPAYAAAAPTWASSNLNSATISAAGLATVVYAGVGTGTISATSGGVTGSTGLTTVLQQTWVNGSSTVNALGVYGTKGSAAAANVPGGRYASGSWIDAAGNLWLFGGVGFSSTGSLGYLSDLWKFSPATGQWTWVSGSSTVNATGVYGTKGTAAAANVPGARSDSVSWTDAAGNLWLFGGVGYDSAGSISGLNDLWKWDGTNWTWISGSTTAGAAGVYGTKGTTAATNVPGARDGSVTWKDALGKIWIFGGNAYNTAGMIGWYNDLWMWDGANWTWVSGSSTIGALGVYGTKGTAAAANVPGARSGSVSWTDAAGNLWLFGGNGNSSMGGFPGKLNDLWKWDGTNWTWISGSTMPGAAGVYGIKGTAAAANVPGARDSAVTWQDAAGNVWLFGGVGYGSVGGTLGNLNDVWKWDGTNWTWISGGNTVNALGVYGTQGIAAATNVPGARQASISWADGAGNLWLFGGLGYGSTATQGYLNDLWKLSP
ncbi:MAG: Ig-like domain-containing protein [Deltaproteobacteria bacterium]|nr:Ig-like domain-containing protein [Deltaproteobacteria bacterium]